MNVYAGGGEKEGKRAFFKKAQFENHWIVLFLKSLKILTF